MFPINPMMQMPGFPGQQPTAEQTAQMQRLALQNQQLQLQQTKQMLEQYAKSIDAALEQIDEQFAKLEKGEAVAIPAHNQIQAQALAQRLQYEPPRALSYQYMDRFRDPMRYDPQNWVMSGMGDFGRPVY